MSHGLCALHRWQQDKTIDTIKRRMEESLIENKTKTITLSAHSFCMHSVLLPKVFTYPSRKQRTENPLRLLRSSRFTSSLSEKSAEKKTPADSADFRWSFSGLICEIRSKKDSADSADFRWFFLRLSARSDQKTPAVSADFRCSFSALICEICGK